MSRKRGGRKKSMPPKTNHSEASSTNMHTPQNSDTSFKSNKIKDIERQQSISVVLNDEVRVNLADSKHVSRADIINIIMAALALISIFISGWTVREMIKDRNAAYSPDILMNPIEINFSWDRDGNEVWLSVPDNRVEPTITDNKDGTYTVKDQISLQAMMSGYFNRYSVVNIGVGSAKNITFSWNSGNIQRLLDCLIACNPSKKDFCKVRDDSVTFLYSDLNHLLQVDREETTHRMYMLPEAETDDEYSIGFPLAYTILIQEIIKTGNYQNSQNDNGPYLILTITGKDIQGNIFEKNILILIKRIGYLSKEDGSGDARYQIVPSYAVDE